MCWQHGCTFIQKSRDYKAALRRAVSALATFERREEKSEPNMHVIFQMEKYELLRELVMPFVHADG